MTDESWYNNTNDNANDSWTGSLNGTEITGEIVERIDLTTADHITKTGCTHMRTKRQPATEFDGAIDEISCRDCPLGWFEVRG